MKYDINITVDFSVKLTLTEKEAIALDAIAGYGAKNFLEVFKKHMGSHYISEGEESIPALFDKLRELDVKVKQIQKARKDILEILK